MPPILRIAIAARRAGILTLAAAGFLIALLIAACGLNQDVLANGGSSGVDNPELTLGFRDASGMAMRVTGDVNVYSLDQNPAVNAQPLVTLQVRNNSFTNLKASDLTRAQATAKRGATPLAKTSAAAGTIVNAPSTSFNIILKTQDLTGSFVLGLKYDSASRQYSFIGGDSLKRVNVQPKPLVNYKAKIARDSVHGDAGRIFIPGTPFLATVVDSTFIIENMPEGVFPIRLLAADGKVYPIKDSLNTGNAAAVYHPEKIPVSTVDTSGGKDSLPEFSVIAGPDHEAFIELPGVLEAKVLGVGPTDPRLSFLWQQILGAGDSGRADTLLHIPPDSLPPLKPGEVRKAIILTPTQLRTELKFQYEGVYKFEIAATLGLRVRTDTVLLSVRRLPPPVKPRIILPAPGDSLVEGRAYSIQWEMPDKGPVTVQVSVNNGETWISLASHYSGKDGLPIFPWIPEKSLGISTRCLIQVGSEADTTLHARMDGFFNLLQ